MIGSLSSVSHSEHAGKCSISTTSRFQHMALPFGRPIEPSLKICNCMTRFESTIKTLSKETCAKFINFHYVKAPLLANRRVQLFRTKVLDMDGANRTSYVCDSKRRGRGGRTGGGGGGRENVQDIVVVAWDP